MSRMWSACWAPLVVVLAHSGLAAVFGHRREYDPAFHFIGGAAGAFCLLRALKLFRFELGSLSRTNPVLIVFVVMLVMTGVWEALEFGSDRLLETHVQLDANDTIWDVLLGLVGALTTLAVVTLVGSKSNPSRSKG